MEFETGILPGRLSRVYILVSNSQYTDTSIFEDFFEGDLIFCIDSPVVQCIQLVSIIMETIIICKAWIPLKITFYVRKKTVYCDFIVGG